MSSGKVEIDTGHLAMDTYDEWSIRGGQGENLFMVWLMRSIRPVPPLWLIWLMISITLPLWAQPEATPSKKLAEQTASESTRRQLAPGQQYVVYKIELHEEIMSADVPFFLHRALVAAKAAKADAVVLDLDTPGGRVDLMMEIRDDLITLKMPTYSYINNSAISAGSLIAIAMEKIVMSPISTIGGAQVISSVGEISEVVEQKMVSILKSEVRATARYRNHPVDICEAFFDRSIEIPGLSTKGQVLTMDQEQATTFIDPRSSKTLAAYVAQDLDELLQKENLWPAEIMTYEMTWSEKLAKWLMGIKGILLLVGLGALLLEIKTPGVGVAGAVGALALALFFWSAYLADLANFIEIAFFALGIVLLLIEILVLPGFGVAGVSGVFLIVLSLVLAMFKLPPPDIPDLGWNMALLTRSLRTIVIVFFAMIPLAWLAAKYLPSAPLFRHLVLTGNVPSGGTGSASGTMSESLLGATGVALTDLRPSGMAKVGDRRIDVVTEGDYITRGETVKIVEVQGSVHVVIRQV